MLKPLGDKRCNWACSSGRKTASGIVLPDTAKEKPQEGKVIAVGTGRVLENGERVALEVAAGDLYHLLKICRYWSEIWRYRLLDFTWKWHFSSYRLII